jgi:hypothetical protein
VILVALAVPARFALGQPAGGLEFAEWTAVSSNTATGTLAGRPISLSGTHVSSPPASVVDGTATVFSGPSFSPPLATSDAIEIRGYSPAYSYTLDLGGPTPNPVIHLASLGSTLDFPAGTEIARVSGDSTFTVSGHTVSGVANTAADDSHGTIRLTGVFNNLNFTATYGGAFPDGVFVQLGADFAPPETKITVGPPSGTVVGDAQPIFQFTSNEPGSRFECRAYDPANPEPNPPEKVFRPCSSPYQPGDATFELGEQTLFEVRAIDSSGNVDPSPASRLYVRHGQEGVAPTKSKCDPVPIDEVIGKKVEDNCRITQIKHGAVPCVQVDTGKPAKCEFSKRRHRWLRSRTGRQFAVVGDPIAKGKGRVGRYVIAVPVGEKKVSPCADVPKDDRAARRDATGVSTSYALSPSCIDETMLAPWDASGMQMDNYATQTVCTSSLPPSSAFGPSATATTPASNVDTDLLSASYQGSPEPGVYCYSGEGAALNDVNGTERDIYKRYFSGRYRCHLVIANGYETYGAKRPATTGYPLRVDPHTPVVWRPVATTVRIAN